MSTAFMSSSATSGTIINKREKVHNSPTRSQVRKPSLMFNRDFPSRVILERDSVNSLCETSRRLSSFDGESLTVEKLPEKAPITHWRRPDSTDVEAIEQLIDRSEHIMNQLFSEPDVPNLIEKSSFAMVQFNSNDELISFTSAFSYPIIPAVPSFEWYPWMDCTYKIADATPRNCFFIHYMVWEPNYYEDFLRLTLETMFVEYNFLKNIIITKPPLVKLPEIYSEFFIQVLPQDAKKYNCGYKSLQTVLLCLRHTIIDRLKIRLAIAEDHDDLMPIIERQTRKLRELYGDFCMAELIDYPGTEDRKTLVCEVMRYFMKPRSKGFAVGLMSLNRAVDLELLNSQFYLGVFNGLRKPDSRDKPASCELFGDHQQEIFIPDQFNPDLNVVTSEHIFNMLNWKPSLCISKEDVMCEESTEETDDDSHALSKSMFELVKRSMDVEVLPKFTAYALGSTRSEGGLSEEKGSTDLENAAEEASSIKSELSLVSLQYYNLPEYRGPSNAFCIELFAVHEDIDERLCNDFLEAAFELFPDLDYCILTLPSQCPVFPLLDNFVRVTPRPLKRFKQELYVCHKSSIIVSFMRVRRITKGDLDEIYNLLNGITTQDRIYADIVNSCFFEDSAYQGFVLICDTAIVGVAVVCNENGMEYLTHHFRVADLIEFHLHKIEYHAILKHLVLSPIYQTHARFFLRDIMRMADITSLYRARYEELQNDWNSATLITVLGQFVPVKPRRMVKYHEPSLGKNVPPPYLLHYETPFALYHINSRICGLKKFTTNINVVVIGASRTAFAFLEALLFSPSSAYVTYNNITLVSPHGMGNEVIPHEARDNMFPFLGKFDRRYNAQMCLKTYVNFVYGVMTEINRSEKYVVINNDAIIRYDYLILLCGRQFLMPVPMKLAKKSKPCYRLNRPRCSLYKYLVTQQPSYIPPRPYPPNVFLINTNVDATNAIVSLQYLLRKRKNVDRDEKIVIYGHNLEVYLCVQSLLKFGIYAEMIVLVEPFPRGTNSLSCFNDPNVDRAVIEALKDLHVEHYKGYFLYDWSQYENQQIQTATFHSKNRRVTFQVLALFPYEEKLVSDVTFRAVNEASLVYDGNLIINDCFRTNDPYIYAAGPFTKYERKYFAKDKSHQYFNACEIGKHLAGIVQKKVDPTMEDSPADQSDLVPEMVQPVYVFGQLPGGWNYFHLKNPGKSVPLETAYNIKEYGEVLITGDCKMSRSYGYFRLHLDEFSCVKTITCYTKDEIDIENLPVLYGLHERLLNSLLMRFDLGLIPDFFSYFREPWVYAIYHDRFKYVTQEGEDFFNNEQPVPGQEKVIDEMTNALKVNNWKKLGGEILSEIRERYEESDVKKQIQQNLLDFLLHFDEPFPMYATPSILRVLFHDSNRSLLHRTPATECDVGRKPAIRISESES